MGNSENKKLNIYSFGDNKNFCNSNNYEQNQNTKDSVNESTKHYNFENKEFYNRIPKFSGEKNWKNNFNLLLDEIRTKLQKNPEYNCILIFLDDNNYHKKMVEINECLDKNSKVYRPIVILAFNEKNKNKIDISSYQNKYEIVFYNEDDYTKIDKEIESVYNYYFNIGDDGFINFFQLLKDFTSKNKKSKCKPNIFTYKATFNILVMGKTGCGKSTLINLLLGKQRAREGIGYSITKFYSQYVHEKYPITFTDTVGFEDNKSFQKMGNFLINCKDFFNEGKSKFHLVLYLINAGSERTFMETELNLIDYIRNNLNLPIFFVCTHSRTEEDSQEFKEEVKISLIQYLESKVKSEKSELNKIREEEIKSANQNKEKQTNSTNENETEENLAIKSTVEETGSTNKNLEEKSEKTKNIKEELMTKVKKIEEEKTKLINDIYCCHLVNEKDGKYKRFGIDEILLGIKTPFLDEIKEIIKIGEDFTAKTNKKGISTITQTENIVKKPALNILRSLENSRTFPEYLKNLSENICKNYKNKIYNIIEENKPDIDSKIKELIEVFKNHLAFELNCKLSDLNVDESNVAKVEQKNTFQNIPSSIPFLNIKIKKKEKKEELDSLFKKIKEKIDNKMKVDIENIDCNMNEVIGSYKNAIDSLEKIIGEVNENL